MTSTLATCAQYLQEMAVYTKSDATSRVETAGLISHKDQCADAEPESEGSDISGLSHNLKPLGETMKHCLSKVKGVYERGCSLGLGDMDELKSELPKEEYHAWEKMGSTLTDCSKALKRLGEIVNKTASTCNVLSAPIGEDDTSDEVCHESMMTVIRFSQALKPLEQTWGQIFGRVRGSIQVVVT